MKIKKASSQSVFDKKIQLDEKTERKFQAFSKQMEELKNKPAAESEFSCTIVCGPKEFREIGDKPEKSKD